MPIDLLHSRPNDLAFDASWEALLEAVEAVSTWTSRHARVLDHVYATRLLRILGRTRAGAAARRDEQELRDFADHLRRVASVVRRPVLNALDERYGDAWLAYARLLALRLDADATRAPSAVLARAHVRTILDLVAEGAVTSQAQLRDHPDLALKPANLTRILNLMEANGLIERTSVGRENRLTLGPAAPRPAREPAEPTHRGATYFIRSSRTSR